MSTTSIIVEKLIVGFFTTGWLSMMLLRWFHVDLAVVPDQLQRFSSWVPVIVLAATALCYQAGVLMDALCYFASELLGGRCMRRSRFKTAALDYSKVRATVYQKASQDLRSDLGVDRSIIRLSRSGGVNFAILAVMAFVPRWLGPPWGNLPLRVHWIPNVQRGRLDGRGR